MDDTSSLFDDEKYDKLIKYCNSKLDEKPNYIHTLWYPGKAYYHKKEYEKSLEYFDRVRLKEPSWDESYVKPYI